MAVQIDLSTISNVSASGATSPTTFTNGSGGIGGFTLNLGTGPNGTSNLALVIAVLFTGATSGTASGVTCKWGGVSMTLIGSLTTGGCGDGFLFGLRNPATGSNNVVVSWTGAADQACIGLLSVVGADQTADVTTFINFTTNTGTATANSISITNASGNIAVAGHLSVQNYTTQGNTDIGHQNGGSRNAAAMNYDAGVNPTLIYSHASGLFGSLGCSIAAVAGGPAFLAPPPYIVSDAVKRSNFI